MDMRPSPTEHYQVFQDAFTVFQYSPWIQKPYCNQKGFAIVDVDSVDYINPHDSSLNRIVTICWRGRSWWTLRVSDEFIGDLRSKLPFKLVLISHNVLRREGEYMRSDKILAKVVYAWRMWVVKGWKSFVDKCVEELMDLVK